MRSIAELLGLHAETIAKHWRERVAMHFPDGEPELSAQLPRLLRELAQAMEDAAESTASAGTEYPDHRSGFDLERVAHEYALLRECVLDVLEREGTVFQMHEIRALTRVFSDALLRAVSEHSDQAHAAERAHTKAAHAERVAQHELFMQAPVAIAILEGPQHKFTFANPAYRDLIAGRDPVGKPLAEALPELRGQGFDKLLDGVIATGEPFVGKEVPVRLAHRGQSKLVFLDFVYSPKRSVDGGIDGVLVSANDVTDQVRARRRVEALAEDVRVSEAELRLVTNALPVLVSFVNSDERYVLVNKAYEDWFGIPHEQLIGRTLAEVLGPAAYAKLRPFVLRGLAGEEFSFDQFDVPYRLGGTRDIRVWFVPRVSSSGSVVGYAALLQDITATRRADLALQHQTDALHVALATADRLNERLGDAELILRNLVNNLPDLAWSAAPDGHIDFYNQRWFDYTGTTLEDVQGWGWEKVHDPDVLPAVKAAWQRSLDTGEAFEMEFPLRAADGTFQWFLTRVRPLRDSSGTLLRWIGTNTNIHQQREATRRAEEASRAKDEFLATASHELRTPLNAILGWARILRSGQLEPNAYARGLETIERNARAQVQLIEDILDGSRIITGKLHLEIQALDVNALVLAAIDSVRPAADAKGIELSLDLDPAAAQLEGDAERLQQVVWNLANNAVKFTPRGGKVQVQLSRSESSVELTVADNGQGIDAAFLPFVFDRFRQAEGTSTRRYGGLGLGLALVRHLVEAHGGTVRAESEGPGRGARFVVALPVRAVFKEQPESERIRAAVGEQASLVQGENTLAGVSVLVVDDELDARELVATVLEANGAVATTASSAGQALTLLGERLPQVLLSDISMPDIDGYELIRRVRSSLGVGGAELPAIALTAYSREQDRRMALEAGFQTHLAKPFEPAELVRVVGSLVRYVKRESSTGDREVALQRADAFLKFEKILQTQGVQEALQFLNSRTSHRFTAIYRFEAATLRNLFMVDSYNPEVKLSVDAPLAQTYGAIVRDTRSTFATEDARNDDRIRTHPGRREVVSYCGVLLRDTAGGAFGALCHFDVVPSDVPASEIPLMEAAAPLLMGALARSSQHEES